tara:strand:- start:7935 stop:8924 length:990 start_codon:yes stop_codon:yes gene_type:complete
MRNLILIYLLIIPISFVYSYEDPKKYKDIDPEYANVEVIDPDQNVGYTIGDLIHRKVKVSIKKPFSLIEESLPIVGYEKRYRGELLGMTLRKADFSKEITNEKSVYDIDLTYQVFTNKDFAKPGAITADYYRVINSKKPDEIFKIRIPSFTFAISPIAVFGAVKVEENMSEYRGPFLLDASEARKTLKYASALLLLCFFILFYIYSRYSWWPRQNRVFSQIYSKYKKTEFSQENLEAFTKALHNGLDKSLGQTVFIDNLNLLYKQNTSFQDIEDEIHDFFKLSRKIFFDKNGKINRTEAYKWLKDFALHCRFCERKLTIDKHDLKRFAK